MYDWAAVFLGFGLGCMVMSFLYNGILSRSRKWREEAEAERKDAYDRLMAQYDRTKKLYQNLFVLEEQERLRREVNERYAKGHAS